MDDEVKYEKNRKENEILLDEFCDYLKEKNLSPKTVRGHINNLDLYLNNYLNDHNYASAKEGISYGYCADFLDYFFISKCMWSTPSTLRSTAASLKKFYGFMYEKGLIEKEAYDGFRSFM